MSPDAAESQHSGGQQSPLSSSIRQRKSPFAHLSHSGEERSFKMRRHGEDDYGEEDMVIEQTDDPIDMRRMRSQIDNELAINRSQLQGDSTVHQDTPVDNSHKLKKKTKTQVFGRKTRRIDDL